MLVPNWDKYNPDPCKECDERQQDDCYGRVCDWWCNKGIAYANKEAGAMAMLEALMELASESPTGTFVIDSKIINIYGNNGGEEIKIIK